MHAQVRVNQDYLMIRLPRSQVAGVVLHPEEWQTFHRYHTRILYPAFTFPVEQRYPAEGQALKRQDFQLFANQHRADEMQEYVNQYKMGLTPQYCDPRPEAFAEHMPTASAHCLDCFQRELR